MSSIHPNQDHYFPSKRDWWIVALIWMGVVAGVVGGIGPLVLAGASWIELVAVGSVLLLMDSLMLWVLYGTGYTIRSDRLFIRCGPISFHLRLDSIESITPTKSPWAGPACSLDRLKVVYGVSQQSLMISPKRQTTFLSAIVRQCPSLIVLHNQVRKKTDSFSSAVDPAIQPHVTL